MKPVVQRIVIPIALAIFFVAALLVFTWWKIRSSALLNFTNVITEKAPIINNVAETLISNMNTAEVGGTIGTLREGELLAEQGRWSEALVLFEQVASEDESLLALRKVIQAELQLNQYDNAVETLAKLREAGAKPDDITLLQSVILVRTGKIQEAKTLLSESTESAQQLYGLMLVSIAEGNHQDAQKYSAQVITGNEPVLRNNAKIIANAYEEFALFPESTNSHLITLLARALAEVQECALSLPLITQVTATTPNYRDAWIVQGFCELQTEQHEKATRSFLTAYNIDPQKVAVQYFLGLSYYSSKQYQNAITFFEYALTNGFTPKNELHTFIARSAKQLGNMELALTHYSTLIESEPTEQNYADTIQAALYLQDAVQAYQKSTIMTQLFPKSANAYELLGLSAESLGNTNEAINAFTTAVQLDPERTISTQKLEELQ